MSQGQWFAVATKPLQEQVAKVNLTRQGYRVALPLIEVRKRRQKKWTLVVEPLFSGYIFIQLVLGKDNPAPIRSTLGCRDLVRVGPSLVPVPNAVMAPLLSLNSVHKTSDALFSAGDQVYIAEGAFAGLQGVFKLAKGADRAEVLVALMGKERPVTVPFDDLVFC